MKRKPTPLESPPDYMPTSPEAQENECINLAYQLVRQRLINGTATSAETVHFLKLGTLASKVELEKAKKEVELLEARKNSYETASRIEALYGEAITAMREYSMFGGEEAYDEDIL